MVRKLILLLSFVALLIILLPFVTDSETSITGQFVDIGGLEAPALLSSLIVISVILGIVLSVYYISRK